MITIRKAKERGHFDHGWLNTNHTFSFGAYQDPNHMGFRTLRVMNEDRVAPGAGFGTHPHRDMEIISYVIDGQLAHRDSMGNGSTLTPGMFQRMTAGAGVEHSEFNASQSDPLHFYQIWIIPEERGLDPSYEERAFKADDARDRFQTVAARDPKNGAMKLHQDASLSLARLDPNHTVTHELAPGRHAWLQVTRGTVTLFEQPLAAGDGAAISDVTTLPLTAGSEPAEVLLFDLA